MTAIHSRGTASATVLIGLMTSLVIAHLIAPDWSRRVGLDVWNYSAVERDYRRAAEEQDEVDAFAELSSRRRETANQIAAQLVAGTATLPTAADELRELFADDKGALAMYDAMYPKVPCERLRCARNAIERAMRLVEDDPTQTETLRCRLEIEYRAMVEAAR